MPDELTTPFNQFLLSQGYIDEHGALTVSMREAQAAYCLHNIQQCKKRIEQNYIQIAKDLWLVYKHQLWIELGFENFVEFLYSPEIDMRKSVGYAWKDVGMLLEEGVITEDDVRGLGPSKIRLLLPVLREESEDREEWIEKAKVLTTLDLEDEVRGHDIMRYSGRGMLEDLLREISEEPIFWEREVILTIKTC